MIKANKVIYYSAIIDLTVGAYSGTYMCELSITAAFMDHNCLYRGMD